MSVFDPSAPAVTIGGKRASIYLGESGDGANAIVEEIPEEGGPRAVVTFQCLYADRFDIFKGLAGGSSLDEDGNVVRVAPFAYPPNPVQRCVSISDVRGLKPRRATVGEGDAAVANWVVYEGCQFKAAFAVPKWDFDGPTGQDWTTTRVRVSAEVLQVPLGTFLWTAGVDSGKPVPESSIGILVPRNEISMTRHWMPYVPLAAVNQYIGTINSSDVTLGDFTYLPGHLLFAGFNATETADTLGTRVYEVEYVLIGNVDHDFNELLDRQAVYRVINTAVNLSGQYPFRYANFFNSLP